MLEAWISRFGDRTRDVVGLRLKKVGVNVYQVETEAVAPFIHVAPETEHRVASLARLDAHRACIYTFNLLNGYYPGADLRVRVYTDDDPDLLAVADVSATRTLARGCHVVRHAAKTEIDAPAAAQDDTTVLVQPHSTQHRFPVVTRVGSRISVETLITRTPPIPVETNIEIAVVRTLGPLRSR